MGSCARAKERLVTGRNRSFCGGAMNPYRLTVHCGRAAFILALFAGAHVVAQERPGLLFREDWKETPAATPVTQEHVTNPDLVVTRLGPGEALIKKSHHDKPADDPF